LPACEHHRCHDRRHNLLLLEESHAVAQDRRMQHLLHHWKADLEHVGLELADLRGHHVLLAEVALVELVGDEGENQPVPRSALHRST
jgi:hypothetical protein